MPAAVTRDFDAGIEVDRAERTIVATVNTGAVDRYRTVIVPEGGRFENYRRNPVVLYNHDGARFPVGKNLWIKADKRRILAKTKFLPAGRDELADKVFDLYEAGFLHAWSISFDPIDAGAPTADEIRRRPELAACKQVFRAWDLLEYSCVTIPANPEAARQARSRGLALPEWAEAAPPPPGDFLVKSPPAPAALPPLAGRSLDQVLAAVGRGLDLEVARARAVAAKDARELARGMV